MQSFCRNLTVAFIFLAIGMTGISLSAASGETDITYPPALLDTPGWLEARRQEQFDAAKGFKAFHDFLFSDQTSGSGIRFEQRSVDDAGKYWKPAHYDHGTGVAVADVDG